MKIVVNKCYGGFRVSDEFSEKYPRFSERWNIPRADEDFIKALEDFGLEKASGCFSKLRIVEIPDDVTDWEIDEYDGIESITYVVDGRLHHL